MSFTQTSIDNVIIVTPKKFEDERGYFFEGYNKKTFTENGIPCDFVQDNQSFSSYGTLRGLHLQTGTSAQAKLVRVIKGAVLDVAVDLRPTSNTFGQHVAVELTEENGKQLFIPRDFAHGFVVLSETAEFFYKCDNFYDRESESGIIFNDSDLKIDWTLSESKLLLSQKDQQLPTFSDFKKSVLCI